MSKNGNGRRGGQPQAAAGKALSDNSKPSLALILAHAMPRCRAALAANGAGISALAQALPQTAAAVAEVLR